MKSVVLVQIFCPVKETNRTHSKGYVEDLSTQTGRKRCPKMAWLNLSVIPQDATERTDLLGRRGGVMNRARRTACLTIHRVPGAQTCERQEGDS